MRIAQTTVSRPVSTHVLSHAPAKGAFTLIEMLVVIAIIAILAGLLLPALFRGKIAAKVKVTKSEMQGLAMAISTYHGDYNRAPVGKTAETEATAAVGDFTYGTQDLPSLPPIRNGYGKSDANNSRLMYILMSQSVDVNLNHVRNPRKIPYYTPKHVSGDGPGLSTSDGVLRDPFGNPYIITLDMNDDNKCRDAYYQKAGVSEAAPGSNAGFYGLTRATPADPFEIPGEAMIWTFGPDRAVGGATTKANVDPNKDNILSWQ
jgi:prepilin-type N-terminal cleavage/methylation domain-containing protein